jgi:hypothetical protein
MIAVQPLLSHDARQCQALLSRIRLAAGQKTIMGVDASKG